MISLDAATNEPNYDGKRAEKATKAEMNTM